MRRGVVDVLVNEGAGRASEADKSIWQQMLRTVHVQYADRCIETKPLGVCLHSPHANSKAKIYLIIAASQKLKCRRFQLSLGI